MMQLSFFLNNADFLEESVFTYDIEQATNPYAQPPNTGKTVDI